MITWGIRGSVKFEIKIGTVIGPTKDKLLAESNHKSGALLEETEGNKPSGSANEPIEEPIANQLKTRLESISQV